MPRMSRVLDAGTGPDGTPSVNETFQGADITRLGLPGSGCDVEFDLESEAFQAWEPEPFDVIVMSHSLEHVSMKAVQPVLRKWYALLRPAGEESEGVLHIMVPSLEWAAEQIYSEHPNPVFVMHLYGSQTDAGQYHKCGFTLPILRQQIDLAGFQIRQAGRSHYKIGFADGSEVVAEELYVAAIKRET